MKHASGAFSAVLARPSSPASTQIVTTKHAIVTKLHAVVTTKLAKAFKPSSEIASVFMKGGQHLAVCIDSPRHL